MISSNNADSTTMSSSDSASLDLNVRMDVKQQLENNCKRIRKRYASFVSGICKHLVKKEVTVGELRTFLGRLPALEDRKDFKSLFREADTINAMFDLIGDKFASFLHYDIFQSILDEYCTESEKCSEALKYSKHIKDYINQHSIQDFMQISPTLKKYTNDSTKLHLKIDIEKSCKIAEVVDFERTIADILEIRQSMLQLHRIDDGCVTLTFLIPSVVAENILKLTKKQIKKLQCLSVLWLECGIYKIDLKEQGWLLG